MKRKYAFLCFSILMFLFASCSFDTSTDDTSTDDTSDDMYVSYKLDNSILFETGLPVVSIQTENDTKNLSKEKWQSAEMKIENAENENWNINSLEISIRGRGNSTWVQSKRPYAIKLSSKQKILGMSKHKRWVLIANYLDNSFIKNEMAFYISRQIRMDYTVNGKYVNLVLNGNYVGLYWLGEAIKIDKNRVSINEENDFLLEMDVYYDETWKFHSSKKRLPYLIKNDDYMTQEKLDLLKARISEMEEVLYGNNFPYTDENKTSYDRRYEDYIDLDSFAKFYVVNEIMHNGELGHPKSCYFTFTTENGYLKAGPVWDYDWACGTTATQLSLMNTIYYDALFKIPEFNEKVNNYLSDSLITANGVSEEVERLRNEISKAVVLDGQRWGTNHRNPVGNKQSNFNGYVDDVKNCIVSRLNAMKNTNFQSKCVLE